jgi:hypothetical protein
MLSSVNTCGLVWPTGVVGAPAKQPHLLAKKYCERLQR